MKPLEERVYEYVQTQQVTVHAKREEMTVATLDRNKVTFTRLPRDAVATMRDLLCVVKAEGV